MKEAAEAARTATDGQVCLAYVLESTPATTVRIAVTGVDYNMVFTSYTAAEEYFRKLLT